MPSCNLKRCVLTIVLGILFTKIALYRNDMASVTLVLNVYENLDTSGGYGNSRVDLHVIRSRRPLIKYIIDTLNSELSHHFILILQTVIITTICFLHDWLLHYVQPGPALSQLDQLLTIGPRAGVIFSRLFKCTHQHKACFYREQHWATHLLRSALCITTFYTTYLVHFISSLSLVLRWLLFCLFCSSVVVDAVVVTAGTFEP